MVTDQVPGRAFGSSGKFISTGVSCPFDLSVVHLPLQPLVLRLIMTLKCYRGQSAKQEEVWDEPEEAELPVEPDDGSPQTKEAIYEPEVAHEPQREASSRRWENLPKSAQIGIPTSTAIVTALGVGILAFCCIRQRRVGRKEYNAESSKMLEEQQNGGAAFRSQLSRGYRAVR